jgi:hypothetical protein
VTVTAGTDRVTAQRYRPGMERTDLEPRRCPTCGAPAVPIVYGLPGPELWEASERGEVILGGCVIIPENPSHGCTNGHRWLQSRRRNGHRSPWLDPDVG